MPLRWTVWIGLVIALITTILVVTFWPDAILTLLKSMSGVITAFLGIAGLFGNTFRDGRLSRTGAFMLGGIAISGLVAVTSEFLSYRQDQKKTFEALAQNEVVLTEIKRAALPIDDLEVTPTLIWHEASFFSGYTAMMKRVVANCAQASGADRPDFCWPLVNVISGPDAGTTEWNDTSGWFPTEIDRHGCRKPAMETFLATPQDDAEALSYLFDLQMSGLIFPDAKSIDRQHFSYDKASEGAIQFYGRVIPGLPPSGRPGCPPPPIMEADRPGEHASMGLDANGNLLLWPPRLEFSFWNGNLVNPTSAIAVPDVANGYLAVCFEANIPIQGKQGETEEDKLAAKGHQIHLKNDFSKLNLTALTVKIPHGVTFEVRPGTWDKFSDADGSPCFGTELRNWVKKMVGEAF